MKQRNLMVLTLSCALLIIIELGVSIIYSDYIYNPAKGLISINVGSQSYNDPNWEPGMENPTSSQNAANLMQEIDDWANSAKVAVIHKNAFSAGCGYSDYSGWLLSALGVSKAKDETTGGKGVYSNMVKKVIVPYFRERQIALQELSAKHIQDFYLKELERVSASSVIHYHANIHKALKYAVKLDLISSNPADKIERPKKERFMANFYDADEVNRLFEISKGTKLEIPILFGAFYGMRRSETLGMKWDAIDFERDTITIRHTLTTVALDGKRITVAEDRTKNKSSMRTLPLVPFVKERLLELKAEQEENRRLCGRSYVKDYTGYVCINEIGDIIKPNYVSCGFPKLLEEHGLRRVRYHDLRHSCASLLLANGVPMKQIQEWLGHSDFSTTANIYAHLEYSSKVISADAMLAGLGIGNRE